jgi:hypothetical protein
MRLPWPPTPSSPLDAALSYAARGWAVFPCHTPTATGCSCRQDCGRVGKHPRTKNGLGNATTEEATIRRWWKQWPTANVAIRTGAASGLAVLDEDSYKGGDASRVDLEHSYAPLPETVQQLTGGGGAQYLFAHPGTPVKNGVETLGVGLDIRGDGGYIIAPPSLHASGERYAWELTHLPEETPLAPMPPWLLALCQETTRRDVVDAGAAIPDHHRNNTLFKLGSAVRARGFSHAAILGALQAINTTQCQPPLETAEVETIAASCAKYPAGTGGQNGRQQEQDAPPLDPDEPWPDAPANGQTPNSQAQIDIEEVPYVPKPWPQCAPEAFYGLAGKLVAVIDPHTESDPVGILAQFLVMVGNAIGRMPFFPVEADQHHTNLFLCVIGETSKARKGTSSKYPVRVLRSGHLAGAAIDVFEQEPLPSESPLRELPNVILTPHMVGHSQELMAAIPRVAAENALRTLRGDPPLYVKNPEVLPTWHQRLTALSCGARQR